MGNGQISHGLKNKIVWLVVAGTALLGLFGGISLAAAQAEIAGHYTKDGKTTPIVVGGDIAVTKLGNLSPSEMEALFPMSPEDEAKIVHVPPFGNIIIDGVEYKPEDIHLFDGIRLRYIVGKDGKLYAFTTAEGLEKFQAEYERDIPQGSELRSSESFFYTDMWYSGGSFDLFPGYGFPYLSALGCDNAVSSVKATPDASWTYIYDYENFTGEYFAMAGGDNYGMLLFQGWNDRASSASVSQ
jgi:hypothetical protein